VEILADVLSTSPIISGGDDHNLKKLRRFEFK